jgi:hypothetical protein
MNGVYKKQLEEDLSFIQSVRMKGVIYKEVNEKEASRFTFYSYNGSVLFLAKLKNWLAEYEKLLNIPVWIRGELDSENYLNPIKIIPDDGGIKGQGSLKDMANNVLKLVDFQGIYSGEFKYFADGIKMCA